MSTGTPQRGRAQRKSASAHTTNAARATQIAFDARGRDEYELLTHHRRCSSLSYADKESTFRLMLSPQYPRE
jgi:hypothetical protein